MTKTHPHTVIDTCCLINLCTIDRPFEQLISELPARLFVTSSVERESISVLPHATAASNERRHIDLSSYFSGGLIERCTTETEAERQLYVQLALILDDGEAMSLALAVSRGWSLASDDGPARRIASKFGITVIGTPALVRAWAESTTIEKSQLINVVVRIERLARYQPSPSTSEYIWWSKLARDAGTMASALPIDP